MGAIYFAVQKLFQDVIVLLYGAYGVLTHFQAHGPYGVIIRGLAFVTAILLVATPVDGGIAVKTVAIRLWFDEIVHFSAFSQYRPYLATRYFFLRFLYLKFFFCRERNSKRT